jgi:SAM-dependent methyltransferase
MDKKQVCELIEQILDSGAFKRAVLSRPKQKQTLRADARLVMLKTGQVLQLVSYQADGKALHRNVPREQAPQELIAWMLAQFKQMNLITTGGDCQIMANSQDVFHVVNHIRLDQAQKTQVQAHDAKKSYILPEAPTPFLNLLGVMDPQGRVYDKKRAKFRQINRFLEYVRDAVDKLPDKSGLCVYDLCCGKAYLTFALYYYLVEVRKLDAVVYGVDRKQDVMDHCAQIAQQVGFDRLHFSCGDIESVRPAQRVDIVAALHACDTATDVALAHAVKWNAQVILSAPCCQHELAGQMRADAQNGLWKQPLLRYRMAQLLTDALRTQVLELCGYAVSAVEFIDPDQTDKNLLLRAVRTAKILPRAKREALMNSYLENTARYGVSPTLAVLLRDRLEM